MLIKEQLDAIKERVAKMSPKVAEIDKLERIAFQDVPALIAEVERLQQFERKAIYVIEENRKLREALKFYADKENWEWHEINDLETAPGDILNDNGETARKALQHE